MGEGAHAGLNVVSLFMEADWVVKGVMIGLAISSSVVVGGDHRQAVPLRRPERRGQQASNDKVGGGRPLEEVGAQAGASGSKPLPQAAGHAAARLARGPGAGPSPTPDRPGDPAHRPLLDSIIARESQPVEDGLGSLAIVATASPFIGLFGTVWGIMNAFQAIAIEQNTNLAVVAPAIAEALFATAIGLAAAIPAYIAYNKFSPTRQVRRPAGELRRRPVDRHPAPHLARSI
jgi:biopolymer transport protein TolQ